MVIIEYIWANISLAV